MKNEMQNFFSKILLYAGTVFVDNCPLLLSVNHIIKKVDFECVYNFCSILLLKMVAFDASRYSYKFLVLA